MSRATPDRIGRYRVSEVIGVGGFATVYRATDERLGSDVAVKVLAENHSLDADVRERFVEEGRRLRRVQGPHLLAVHDIGETERAQPYLVLDLADRGDLATRVAGAREGGRPPRPDDILAVGQAVGCALGVVHRNHLVHRDLAPKNLLLCSASVRAVGAPWPDPCVPGSRGLRRQPLVAADEQVALADLGLSKDLAVASGLTVATGTSGFAPPEQREHGGTVDSRADIWAASALVVWLAIDRTPDDLGEWRQHLRDAGWSPELVRMLTRGLARRPQDRYQTIEEWSAALLSAVRPPGPAFLAGGREPGWWLNFGRRPVALMVAALATLALGAGLGAAGVTVIGERDDPTVRTEQLGEGNERTVVEEHGITITLNGPTTLLVGESARFTASVDGAESWEWVGPDGRLVVEINPTGELELEAQRAGHVTVRLLALDERGQIVEARRPLNVVD